MKKVFLVMAVLISAVFTVSAQSADDIITKYITAIGGAEKWSKVQSIKIEGQIEMQGIAIPFVMQGVQMKGTRVDAEFQGNKIIDITTPSKGWSQNPFGGKATLSPSTDDELKHNDFVRYIKYDPIKKRELFRTGGNVLRNAKDYVTIRGNNNLIFSVSKYVKDNNGDIIYNTRFFKKLNNDDIFKKDVQKILEKSNELIKKQTKIIQSLQKEIEMLKNL
jgi:hypothetical protein